MIQHEIEHQAKSETDPADCLPNNRTPMDIQNSGTEKTRRHSSMKKNGNK